MSASSFPSSVSREEGRTAVVVGGGSFGTAMAAVIANNFKKVIVLVRSPSLYEDLKRGVNQRYLPGTTLPPKIVPALSWGEVREKVEGRVELLTMGIPTAALSEYSEKHTEEIVELLEGNIPLVCLAKGIHTETLELPDDLLLKHFRNFQDQICFLSGPSFANEILDGKITAVTVAGRSRKVLESVGEMFSTDFFKVFKSYDVKGVLLGGALKNVVAIAGGIVEGLGLSYNTRSALITLAIREMLRFGVIYSARPETFYGLSGVGDLILTTTGGLSRNKQFGLEIAKGRKPEEIISSSTRVVEGYKTAKSIHYISGLHGIYCPIFEAVYDVLYRGIAPTEVLEGLLDSEPGFEVRV